MKSVPVRLVLLVSCALLFLPAVMRSQEAPPAAWTEFVAWYRGAQAPSDPAALFAAYGAKLKADGLPDAAN